MERVVHTVSYPEQRQLAQSTEISFTEIAVKCRPRALDRIDIAVSHSSAQRLRAHVDQLNLVGGTHDDIRNRLALNGTGDLFHKVVQRFEVLNIERGYDLNARIEKLLDVLPPLDVPLPGNVGMGEFIHQHDLRSTGKDAVNVHFLKRCASVFHGVPRNDFQVTKLGNRAGTLVRLDEPDDHIRTANATSETFVEHGKGLSYPGCRPKVNTKHAAAHQVIIPLGRVRC